MRRSHDTYHRLTSAPLRLFGAVALLLGLLLSASGEERDGDDRAAGRGQVWVVDLEGALGPATANLIIRSIANADEAGARALVIRMDTPGGLDQAMRDIVREILASNVPVITYVAPDGARAASAGTYIAYASHIAAMAPATNIGSATPVTIGGPPPESPGGRPGRPQPADGDNEATDETPADEAPRARPAGESPDAMTRKVVNDAIAYLQSLAELRGRNVEWAEEAVRYGANIRASQALQMNVIDVIAEDLPTLLRQIDGTSVTLHGRTVILEVAGAGIRTVETDWMHDLLTIITNPTIAYGLLIFGIYGLILEFYNPGMVFPSVIGIICLLLGAYGLQMLPISYAGLALIVVGIGMMIAEVFTPTLGILGFAGVVAFVMGSIMLIDTDTPGYQLPIGLIAAFAVTSAGLSIFTIGAAVKARHRKVVTGREAMIGAHAEAMEDFDETGQVWVHGERWHAVSDRPVHKGDKLRVTAIDGLLLSVTAE
jgi:membrane-bound serine protease (ClpP class)